MIAKTSACHVQSLVPDQQEWLSVLVYINEAELAISSFYIFIGKHFEANYIQQFKPEATMAMQPRVWMTSYLFLAWIFHFIALVCCISCITLNHPHFIILAGYNSHVTLEVMYEARSTWLNFIILPSHPFHALQPLDVCIFKPFK